MPGEPAAPLIAPGSLLGWGGVPKKRMAERVPGSSGGAPAGAVLSHLGGPWPAHKWAELQAAADASNELAGLERRQRDALTLDDYLKQAARDAAHDGAGTASPAPSTIFFAALMVVARPRRNNLLKMNGLNSSSAIFFGRPHWCSFRVGPTTITERPE